MGKEPFVKTKHNNEVETFVLTAWTSRFSGLTAGMTTRHGGVSEEPFAMLNLGLHVEDDEEKVVANRERLAEAVGFAPDRFVYAEQIHGSSIKIVTNEDAGSGVRSRASALPDTDAFATTEPGVVMAALFADCVPLFFFDPVQRVVALAHAGWKGTVADIAGKTVRRMAETFGSNPEHIEAAIGPSIGVCCYEVDGRVVDRVREAESLTPGADSTSFFSTGEGKYRLNLQECNRKLMIKAGILPSHIEISNLCTSCRTDIFFSHRRENGRTGRMAAWIALYGGGTLGTVRRSALTLIERIRSVEERIAAACERSGRNPQDIHTIAVTKYVSLEKTMEAVNFGLNRIGESRAQDAKPKQDAIGSLVEWHFIGHLQTNKVKDVVGRFEYIHSLDRLPLAEAIDKRARSLSIAQRCFIQVNVSGEDTKYGLAPDELLPFAREIRQYSGIRIVGLMTMAPYEAEPESTRPVFRSLRELRDRLNEAGVLADEAPHLSMGMSNDFEIAIEEGATWIRLGSVLVGKE